MTWSEIDRLTYALEQERRENTRLRAMLYLESQSQGGNPPPEVIEALSDAGLRQEHLDRFVYDDDEVPILIRVKTYPLYGREPSRKEIEAVLRELGWTEPEFGRWRHPDGSVDGLKLRDAYRYYQRERGEVAPDPPKIRARFALYVTQCKEQEWMEKVSNGETCIEIQMGDQRPGRPVLAYAVLDSFERLDD